MSSGEVITIMVLFHYGAFRNLKHFYIHYVCKHMQGEFPQTVSYNRFVELMEKEALSMAVMLKMFCLGECTSTLVLQLFYTCSSLLKCRTSVEVVLL